MKILLQRLCEYCLEWDEPVPKDIQRVWMRWYKELPLLKEFSVARPYFPKEVTMSDVQWHGFCDASEVAYSGIVYIRAIADQGEFHMSLLVARNQGGTSQAIVNP